METGWHRYSASAENLTLAADTGDFYVLLGGGTSYRILEVRVWQRGSTSIAMETLTFNRGTAVSPTGGSGLTEYEITTSGAAASVTAFSLPTGDVASQDLIFQMGWNILQEAVWLPTPRLIIPLTGSQDFSISQESGTAHTGVGVTVTWEEFTGN